ncbi:MAG TPA: D-alanine--D-alanine ligase [Arenibacter sp.]|nr:D-alanine--D-alanine ligase [Arenibacter sp.]
MKKNIAIIMGGYSSEYKISLLSGNVVHDYLDREKFNAYRIHIVKDKWVYVDDQQEEHPVNRHDFSVSLSTGTLRFHCVFNAIHGTPGEDGLMQAYFRIIGLPQTSCDYYQAALTFNKRDLLSVLRPFGIKSAPSYYLNQGDRVAEDDIVNKVGLPCFVKANRAGSSFGVTKVYHKEELAAAIGTAFVEDDEILIESFLKGTEVSVGVIKYEGKTKVLPITEIVPENDFFDYAAKYEGKSQEITPARITKKQENNVVRVAKQIYDTLKMKGYTRSEFILIGDDPYLLEVNTTPGLTTRSILPQQAEVAGISLSELFESSIWEALGENK